MTASAARPLVRQCAHLRPALGLRPACVVRSPRRGAAIVACLGQRRRRRRQAHLRAAGSSPRQQRAGTARPAIGRCVHEDLCGRGAGRVHHAHVGRGASVRRGLRPSLPGLEGASAECGVVGGSFSLPASLVGLLVPRARRADTLRTLWAGFAGTRRYAKGLKPRELLQRAYRKASFGTGDRFMGRKSS